MNSDPSTVTSNSKKLQNAKARRRPPVPGLFVAHAPPGVDGSDRCSVPESFTVGRHKDCYFPVSNDSHISSRHFQITKERGEWLLEDLNSKNGTFVDGKPVESRVRLGAVALILAGNCLFVFHRDARGMFNPPVKRYGMCGTFHLERILADLNEAALTGKHILLSGASGSGKELAATALAEMSMMSTTGDGGPTLISCNAARFSSDEQAVAAVFGVGKRVFSDVEARPGLIELAEGGVLFLDEVHNLSERVQRSLLRVMEDGKFSRLGEEGRMREISVRFVLSSNDMGPSFGLASDLLARLLYVSVPPLKERIADIPRLLDYFMGICLAKHGLEGMYGEVLKALEVEHYEAMCLDGFPKDNVRGILDICERTAAGIASGLSPMEAVDQVFSKRFADSASIKRLMEEETDALSRSADACDRAFVSKPSEAPRSISDLSGFCRGAARAAAPPVPVPARNETCDKRRIYYDNKDLIIWVFQNEAHRQISTTRRILLNKYRIHTSRHSLTVNLQKWGVSVE